MQNAAEEEELARRNQRKRARAQQNTPQKSYLPCSPVVHDFDAVAIDCEMLIVHAADPLKKRVLASVDIVNRDGFCMFEAFVHRLLVAASIN